MKPADSTLVINIWESTLVNDNFQEELLGNLNDIYLKIGEKGFREIQTIATYVMNRAISSMVNWHTHNNN